MNRFFRILLNCVLGLAAAANASALTIDASNLSAWTLGTDYWTINFDTSNKTPAEIEAITGISPLSSLYKSDVPNDPKDGSNPSSISGLDAQTFAGSYDTTFSNSGYDPENALIEWITGTSIIAGAKVLVIKDGNRAPSQYFFNISGLWDGEEDIAIRNFWPDQGAISHLEILGDNISVPDGGITVILLGSSFLAIALMRRRLD